MNILIWSPYLQKVGTASNVYNLIHGVTKYSKHNINSIDLINVFGEWDDYRFKNIKVNKIPLLNSCILKKINKHGYIRSRFFTILIFVFSFLPLLNLLKKKDYDFFFIHLITSLPIFLTNFYKKPKLILHVSGFPKLTIFRKLFWRKYQKNIFKVICPSAETKNLLINNNIFERKKIVVIKDPHISANYIMKMKKNDVNDISDSFKNILAIGRLTKQKNYIFLLQAFKKILSIKDNLRLLIIGEGEERKNIESEIKKLNLMNNVKLLGFQNNIYKYLNNSICYFSTSLWEGPDLAMLDAAFSNVPIICSDCKSGRKEFIGDNERGYKFKTNDLKSAIKALEFFLKDKDSEIKQKLIKAKKEVKNFTQFRYCQKLDEILLD